jgi:uncharacterized protein YqeY
MTIQTDVEVLWKKAMKERSPEKDVLSLIKTELKNKLISLRGRESERRLDARSSIRQVEMEVTEGPALETILADEDALDALNKMAKQRRESITEYEKAGREDLARKENFELTVIEQFLPKQMGDEELLSTIVLAIKESGATGPKDMGKLMKALMPKVKGKADGARIQSKVKEILV